MVLTFYDYVDLITNTTEMIANSILIDIWLEIVYLSKTHFIDGVPWS